MTKKSERNLLNLRKNQIDDYIMSKRKVNNYENYVYQINPSNLFLEENKIIDLDLFLSNVSIYYKI